MDMHICLRQVLLVRSAKKIIGYCLKFAEQNQHSNKHNILLHDYIPNIKYCFNKNVFFNVCFRNACLIGFVATNITRIGIFTSIN